MINRCTILTTLLFLSLTVQAHTIQLAEDDLSATEAGLGTVVPPTTPPSPPIYTPSDPIPGEASGN